MIILLSLDAGPTQRAEVRAAIEGMGLTCQDVQIDERFALVADESDVPAESIGRLPFVDQVVPSSRRDPRVKATRGTGRVVRLGTTPFGGGYVTVVAGPCTIESREALAHIADFVRGAGAAALRGGAFKTRTSPHNYQGGGLDALDRMVTVAREVGLPFFTELTDPRQVSAVADRIDGVQIGARNMQNFPLLVEVAALGKPVLLKRHMAASLDEWLLAAEYILEAGNPDVILCERGIKSAETHVRYLLDVGAIPYLKQRIGLPVIVDPSHAAGHHALVAALARAAVAAGADGLMIEVHPDPAGTRCDAMQALPPLEFTRLMQDVRSLTAMLGRTLAGPVTPEDRAPIEAAAEI